LRKKASKKDGKNQDKEKKIVKKKDKKEWGERGVLDRASRQFWEMLGDLQPLERKNVPGRKKGVRSRR